MSYEMQKPPTKSRKRSPWRREILVRLAVISALALGFSTVEPAVAPAQTAPFKIQAAIILKVLNYDRALKTRASKTLRILVVTDTKTSPKSAELSKAFSVISGQSVQGVDLQVEIYEFKSASQLASDIGSQHNSAVYVPEGISDPTFQAVKDLAGMVPTFAGNAELVEKGLAVGIDVEGGKPKIVVNLSVMRRSGLDLSSTVLKLARVIK